MNNLKIIPFVLAMMLIVLASNYLVQFPFQYFQLSHILTWGAFTYPIAFLVTDIANRLYGFSFTRKIIFIGFVWGVGVSYFFTLSPIDLIGIRIVVGSGIAFLIAQTMDAKIFDKLRNSKKWFVPPFISSLFSSAADTILFFSIAFYGTGVPWVTLGLGDFSVKLLLAIMMLVPFRIIIASLISVKRSSIS